jgi:hypothetical protein
MGIKGFIKWLKQTRYRRALAIIDDIYAAHTNEIDRIERIIAGAATAEDLEAVDEHDYIYNMTARNVLLNLKRKLMTTLGE